MMDTPSLYPCTIARIPPREFPALMASHTQADGSRLCLYRTESGAGLLKRFFGAGPETKQVLIGHASYWSCRRVYDLWVQ